MLVSRSSVRGITIIEVLIVIAIIGLLASLLAPAIQASREFSRRTQCASNFRQLGIAMHAYHSAQLVLPPMIIWHPPGEPLGQGFVAPGVIDRLVMGAPSDNEPDRAYANWICMLLPYLEASAVESRIDYSVPIGHFRNATARATDLEILKCPSDLFSGPGDHFQRIPEVGVVDDGYARNNYAMNAGTNKSCLMGIFPTPTPDGKCSDGYWVDRKDLTSVRRVWGSGIGGVNKSFAFQDFPRGLSAMVALDEIRAGVTSSDPRGVWSLGFVGASATAGHGLYAKAGGPNNSDIGSDVIANCEQVRATVGGAEALAAMGMGCNPWMIAGANFEAGARSLHPNGVNLLMLGGSVHFINNNVDQHVWHNMHRRDSSTPIDLPF